MTDPIQPTIDDYIDDLLRKEEQGKAPAVAEEESGKKKQPALRPIDKKRLEAVQKNIVEPPTTDDRWYVHTVLAQCFLPYRDPKQERWYRKNGDCSIIVTAGALTNRQTNELRVVGLPYGAKPRLFMSYITTHAIKNQSPVVPVQHSMTAMMKELGLYATGGQEGTIRNFKEQVTRLAACNFRIAATLPSGVVRHINAEPFKSFDVWFPSHPDQKTLWASEIILTTEFYDNLKEHAIPYDIRAMRQIQGNARAQDIYLWMTQRLCRVAHDKPLFMTWEMLRDMFGGGITEPRNFPHHFKQALLAARAAYPDARMEEEDDGFRFFHSTPPIQKTRLSVQKSVK